MPPRKAVSCLRSNLLTILTVAGVVGGTIIGLIVRNASGGSWTARQVMYIQFPGEIFLRMLKVLIIPLLVSSVICAVGSLDLSLSKKIAYRSIIYYTTTTFCAVFLGIALVAIIKPGYYAREYKNEKETVQQKSLRPVLTVDTLLDLVRNLFPPNLVEAAISQSVTNLTKPPNTPANYSLHFYDFEEIQGGSANVLGLVMFSIVFGIALGAMGEGGKVLLSFFEKLSEAMMIITGWVIWLSPLGIFFLVTAKILEIDSFTKLVGQLGLYFLTVMIGLFIHGMVTLPIIFFIVTRRLAFRTFIQLGQVLVTAFGTASSSATMPLTIQTLDQMGLDPRVTRFVIPVGATINMDGTALYEAIAAIFIAQMKNHSISPVTYIALSITATAASIGAAGIPQAGLVTMVMVLDTIGLPADQVTVIIAVDWLLDRFRTTINVWGDCLGAKLVDILSQGELGRADGTDRANAEPHELAEITKSNDSFV